MSSTGSPRFLDNTEDRSAGNVALQPRRFMIVPSADGCKRMLCRRLWPEANMYSPRFCGQRRSVHVDRLGGPSEKLTTRHEEIRSSELRELLTRERVDYRADARPVHLPHTHRARFTAGVENGASNLIRRQGLNCARDKIGLGMRSRIAIGDD